MKLIAVTLLILISNSLYALESEYRATEIFSEQEVNEVVSSYYELHDSRAKPSKFLDLVVDDGLYMLMGSEVKSKKKFKSWLKRMRLFSKKVQHEVVSIDISKNEDGSYFVNTCINYKGKLRFGIKFDKTDTITWQLVESPDESKLLIKEYIVKDSCK